jgi:LuxR family maltose regulon positive regulatory protein
MLAEPEGYVRLFIDEGAPMQELLRQSARHGVAPEYRCSQLILVTP